MRLDEIFFAGSLMVMEEDEYWIHGHDEGESYCFDCANKMVAELLDENPAGEYEVDGGWGIEGDSTPYCEICHCRLSNTFTRCGCEEEIKHFLLYGLNPNDPYDCCDMEKVIMSAGWDLYFEKDRKYFEDFYKLCRIILDNYFWIIPDNEFRHMWS